MFYRLRDARLRTPSVPSISSASFSDEDFRRPTLAIGQPGASTPNIQHRLRSLISASSALLRFYGQVAALTEFDPLVPFDRVTLRHMQRRWHALQSAKIECTAAPSQHHRHFVDAQDLVASFNGASEGLRAFTHSAAYLSNCATLLHFAWSLSHSNQDSIEAQNHSAGLRIWRNVAEIEDVHRVFLRTIVSPEDLVDPVVLDLHTQSATQVYIARLHELSVKILRAKISFEVAQAESEADLIELTSLQAIEPILSHRDLSPRLAEMVRNSWGHRAHTVAWQLRRLNQDEVACREMFPLDTYARSMTKFVLSACSKEAGGAITIRSRQAFTAASSGRDDSDILSQDLPQFFASNETQNVESVLGSSRDSSIEASVLKDAQHLLPLSFSQDSWPSGSIGPTMGNADGGSDVENAFPSRGTDITVSVNSLESRARMMILEEMGIRTSQVDQTYRRYDSAASHSDFTQMEEGSVAKSLSSPQLASAGDDVMSVSHRWVSVPTIEDDFDVSSRSGATPSHLSISNSTETGSSGIGHLVSTDQVVLEAPSPNATSDATNVFTSLPKQRLRLRHGFIERVTSAPQESPAFALVRNVTGERVRHYDTPETSFRRSTTQVHSGLQSRTGAPDALVETRFDLLETLPETKKALPPAGQTDPRPFIRGLQVWVDPTKSMPQGDAGSTGSFAVQSTPPQSHVPYLDDAFPRMATVSGSELENIQDHGSFEGDDDVQFVALRRELAEDFWFKRKRPGIDQLSFPIRPDDLDPDQADRLPLVTQENRNKARDKALGFSRGGEESDQVVSDRDSPELPTLAESGISSRERRYQARAKLTELRLRQGESAFSEGGDENLVDAEMDDRQADSGESAVHIQNLADSTTRKTRQGGASVSPQSGQSIASSRTAMRGIAEANAPDEVPVERIPPSREAHSASPTGAEQILSVSAEPDSALTSLSSSFSSVSPAPQEPFILEERQERSGHHGASSPPANHRMREGTRARPLRKAATLASKAWR